MINDTFTDMLFCFFFLNHEMDSQLQKNHNAYKIAKLQSNDKTNLVVFFFCFIVSIIRLYQGKDWTQLNICPIFF